MCLWGIDFIGIELAIDNFWFRWAAVIFDWIED